MTPLALQSDLGIEHVAALHATLLPHLDDEDAIELVGDRVGRVHAAGLQLLHAFVRDRAHAGRQTAVYPLATPGGWHLVGRTDAALLDVGRTPPVLLAPGDRVRFLPA